MIFINVLLAAQSKIATQTPFLTDEFLKNVEKYGITLIALIVCVLAIIYLIKKIFKDNGKEKEKDKETIATLQQQHLDTVTKYERMLSLKNENKITPEKLNIFAESTNKIQILMYHMLSEFKADRISIFEYHNGGKSLTGTDFKKCSKTFEAVELGVTPTHKDYQNLPISINFLWNQLLLEKTPVYIFDLHRIREKDTTIYTILKAEDIQSYYSMLIKEFDGNIIGFVEIMYYNESVELSEKQLRIFNDSVISIAGLLNSK
jgi:hypothetical protein